MGFLWLLIGFILGTTNGVVIMCLMQMNRLRKRETEEKDALNA